MGKADYRKAFGEKNPGTSRKYNKLESKSYLRAKLKEQARKQIELEK
jgi:hypothetical protein